MFKVGQEVVCVNNTPKDDRPESIVALGMLKVGETYTVREIYEHPNGETAITVEEIVNDISPKLGREIGFNIDRFRPLDWVEDILEKIKNEIIVDEIR